MILQVLIKTVWILTEEYNDYDHYGEYFSYGESFLDVFETKPSKEELAKIVKIPPDSEEMVHLLAGGGRSHKDEDQWYFLREIPLKKGGSTHADPV